MSVQRLWREDLVVIVMLIPGQISVPWRSGWIEQGPLDSVLESAFLSTCA